MDTTKPTPPPTLAELLIALRERANITQTAAAHHTGTAGETWRKVERGERSPTFEEARLLMAACQATPEERGAIAAAGLAAALDVLGWQTPAEGEG